MILCIGVGHPLWVTGLFIICVSLYRAYDAYENDGYVTVYVTVCVW